MSAQSPSNFPRADRDHYVTPLRAAEPLLRVLPPEMRFVEPCAGDGALIEILEAAGHVCEDAMDIHPLHPRVRQACGTTVRTKGTIITNPPFRQDMLVPLLSAWLQQQPALVIVLLPIKTMANKFFGPYCRHITAILPIGRVRWFPGTKDTSKDDFVWLILDPKHKGGLVIGR